MTPPRPLPDFIGRDAELATLAEALRTSRLVTILGPGGMGKTTLACEFAARSGRATTFVALEGVEANEQVTAMVAEAMGLPSTGDAEIIRVLRALDGDGIIVIDNAEQVVDGVRELVAQLIEGTELDVVVTSRVALELPEEQRLSLHGLRSEDAAQLLSTIAKRRGVDVAAGEVAALVELLDGLPLAIELAAARTTVLSPGQIASRLERSNEVLGGGGRSRHGTLDRAIAWSWELLSADERSLCIGFATVDRPLLPEFAEEVWSDFAVLDLVPALQSKSWIKVEESGGARRWTMLASIRRFIAAHTEEAARIEHLARLERWALAHLDEAPGWWADHVHAALLVVENLESNGNHAQAARLLIKVFFGAYNRPIFGAVVTAGARVAEAMDPAADPVLWATLATKLSKSLFRLDVRTRPVEWSQRAWDVAPPGLARANAGAQHAISLIDAGARAEGSEVLEMSREELASLDGGLTLVPAMLDVSIAAHDLGRFDVTRETCSAILEIARVTANADAEARACIHLAYASYDLGEFERADEELLRLERLFDKRNRHDALHVGGVIRPLVDLQLGRPERAALGLEECERRAAETGNVGLEYFSHIGWAEWWGQHDSHRAREFLERALSAAGVMTSVKSRLHAQFLLALTAVETGDVDSARRRVKALRSSEHPPAEAGRWFDALDALAWFCDARQGQGGKAPDSVYGELLRATAHSISSVSREGLRAEIAAHEPSAYAIPGLYFFRFDKVALRWFDRLTSEFEAPRLRVAEDGRTFRFEGQPAQDMARRGSMRLILLELVRRRLDAPGQSVSIEDVIAAGWPGEVIMRDAALARAYTTMKRLRSLGLEAWIQTNDEGYLLDPDLDVDYDDC